MLDPADLFAIEQLAQRWLACELENRMPDVLGLCSEEIVWLPPGHDPVRGKEAIRSWLEGSRDRIVEIRLDQVSVVGRGNGASRMANFATRYVASGSSETASVAGWHLWMLRKDEDTVWRVTAVAWRMAGAAPADVVRR